MEIGQILLLSLLIVVWWMGLWGFIETIIFQYIRGSSARALNIYGSMIVFVILVMYLNPTIVEHLI